MNRTQKEQAVAGLTGSLQEAKAVFVTDFQGLKVGHMSQLRRKIGEVGGQYQVAKNTLIRLAVKGSPAEGVTEFLSGNNALGSTASDPAALAKVLVDFAKDHDKLVIKGGVLQGKSLDVNQVKAIASLPSREVLLAKVLGTMNAVPTGFVRVLAAVPQSFLFALSAIRDQKEQPAA